MTGKKTGLARTIRKALKAVRSSKVRFSVIGATALAVRGLPRMSRDLDLVERILTVMHREMVPTLRKRVKAALTPPPAPPRPTRSPRPRSR